MAAVMPHESDSTADEHIETESDGASDFSEDEDASLRDEFIGCIGMCWDELDEDCRRFIPGSVFNRVYLWVPCYPQIQVNGQLSKFLRCAWQKLQALLSMYPP